MTNTIGFSLYLEFQKQSKPTYQEDSKKQNRSRLLNTENKVVVTSVGMVWGKMHKWYQGLQTSVIK